MPGAIRALTDELVQRKQQSGELGQDAPNPLLNIFVESELTRLAATVATLNDEPIPEEPLNQLLWRELGLL